MLLFDLNSIHFRIHLKRSYFKIIIISIYLIFLLDEKTIVHYAIMANFRANSNFTKLEKQNEKYLVNIPMHMSDANLVGEGSFSKVYNFKLRAEACAYKVYKNQYSQLKSYIKWQKS